MAARIVIIDYDESMRELYDFYLHGENWVVLSYDYAEINLSSLKQLHPDLIILAFNRPVGGIGWEFLQILQMDATTASIPIIIRTVVPLSAEMRTYLLTRYIHTVSEPFDPGSFLLLVQQTLTLASHAGIILSKDRPLPILVVEDTEILRDALTTILQFEGYQVASVTDGLRALEAVYTADYCLILLDIAMPEMDGFEFLRIYDGQLRPHSPVLILSGGDNLLTHIFPSFVVGVLPKPYEIHHLLQAVKKYVQPV